tara:strand:+ start:1236 stop:1721 length:486 start_codon:yes stop_codon:yes gene_type:complete
MDHISSFLYSQPGWSQEVSQTTAKSNNDTLANLVGKHCILELYQCDRIKLNDEAFVRTTITTAARQAGATLINLITHPFHPQGVTGLALLAESHISIHTWPEQGYAAVDVFTCGEHTMPEIACQVLSKEFSAQEYSLKRLQRLGPEKVSHSLRNPIMNNEF